MKIQLAQVSFSTSRQFFVKMNGSPWPSDGRPVSITKVLTALRKSIVKSCSQQPNVSPVDSPNATPSPETTQAQAPESAQTKAI